MKKYYALFFISLFSFLGKAQTPDWSTRVASIVYNNCSSCHHAGGFSPFSLMSYNDVSSVSSLLPAVLVSREMPPWPADPAYQHFAHEAVLEQSEIDDIVTWINNGKPIGNISLAPPVPVFPAGGSILDTISYTVQIQPYTLQYNSDEYRYFAMHSTFPDTVYVNKIEVIPGLPAVIHHADIYYDMSGQSYALDLLDPASGFNYTTGTPVTDYYMNAWQPGGNVVAYPPEWGIAVPPGADFVLEIHYGPGAIGQIDTTKMNLRFIVPTTTIRKVKVGWLLYDSPPCLINGPLMIPANTVKTFNQVSAPLASDLSIISICPHMHHIGVSYRVWYKTPIGDSIPLIDIPHWDFHWQKYYTFQHVKHIPAGSKLYSEGVYDNTSNNLDNPNNPPVNVYKGPYTTDEMFLCYFIYSGYQSGDENILLDSTLLTTGVNELNSLSAFEIFPNPAESYFMIKNISSGENMIELFDMLGRKMKEEKIKDPLQRIEIEEFPSGVYFIRLKNEDGISAMKKFVKEN